MPKNWGVIATGATRHAGFTAALGTGAAGAFLSALEAADFDMYKDASAVQRSSTVGFTVVSAFDGLTGGYTISIDFNDNTDAGFYAAGTDQECWLSPDETLDAVVVLGIVAYGTIEAAYQLAVRTLQLYLYPASALGASGSHSTSVIDMTGILDAQTPADAIKNVIMAVRDATDGAINYVVCTALTATTLLATVKRTSNGGVMSFVPASGDDVWPVGTAWAEQLGSQAKLDVNAEADIALVDYDAPTKAELDVLGTAALATAGSLTTHDTAIKALLPTALVGGKMNSDATSISGDSVAADNLELFTEGTALGTLPKVNTEELNATAVIGVGTAGNKWRA